MHYIELEKDLLYENDKIAENLKQNMDAHGVYVLNLMSAPGAGKTSLLEAILPRLKEKYTVAVIEGDMQGSADADRLDKVGVKTIQINTQSICHLEASMVERIMSEIDLHEVDCIIIENVGNLVCPADFYLGEDSKLMVVSVAEGHDKPGKYPIMFSKADMILLNKIDLMDMTNFDRDYFMEEVRKVNKKAKIEEISCIKGTNLLVVEKFIEKGIEKKKTH